MPLTAKSAILLISVMGYPLAVHAAVVLKLPLVGFSVLLAVIVLHLSVWALGRGQNNQRTPWAVWLGMSVVVGLITVAVRWDPTYALFLPPVLINLLLLVVFARSLLPGCEPLITRVARLERDRLPPALINYTRRLTWVWTAFFAAMMLESVLLAAYTSLEVWSLFTNILNYVFVAALFVGEYIYRGIRFRGYRHTPPLRLALNMAQRGLKPLLRS